MRYNGGKSYMVKRHGMGEFWRREFAERKPRRFVDACCGSGAVTTFIRREFPEIEVVANDVHPALVSLLAAVATGWEPPSVVTENDWRSLRDRGLAGDTSPEVGFAGFACSFSGQWFSSYAMPHKRQRDHAGAGRKVLLRDASYLHGVAFHCGDYAALTEKIGVRGDDLWYFDKPYENTIGYRGTPDFDHDAFWARAVDLSKRTRVLVSEFAARPGWAPAWSVQRKLERRGGKDRLEACVRVDCVFEYGGGQ